MRLDTEFFRLPLIVDAARLAAEVAQLDDAEWLRDPEDPTCSTLPLVAAGGDRVMRPTPHLARCPYAQEVLALLRAPVGRTRLTRIGARDGAATRRDWSYYSLSHAQIHIPVVTDPAAKVLCGDASAHMAAGEAWSLDTSRPHGVVSPSTIVHLVADTIATRALWDGAPAGADPRPALEIETWSAPLVMRPAEQEELVELLEPVPAAVRWFLHDWRELWHRHGESPSALTEYRTLLGFFDAALEPLPEREIVRQLLVVPALDVRVPAVIPRRRLDRPVFIVSTPRAGSTLLFETLWRSPSVFTPCGESHELIEGITGLHPAERDWESNRLTAADATPRVAAALEERFLAQLRARDGSSTLPPRVRMVEKTTKSLLRIPFLRALYPDALFIVLERDPYATIGSLLDIWRSGTMVSYPDLPGWEGPPWTLTLVPRWRETNGRPLEEIVAHQWSEGMRILLDDLEALDRASWCVASYETLIAEPQKEIERLCAFAGLAWDCQLTAPLPLSVSALTAPAPGKWRRNAAEIERVAGRIRPVAERARRLLHGAQV
jgi:Sulfotransferase family/Aspartyl/Asparaginyl beta-hydroxylase